MGVPSEKTAHAAAMALREVEYAIEHCEDAQDLDDLKDARGALRRIEQHHEPDYGRD